MNTYFTADLARTRVEDKIRTAKTARLARLFRASHRVANMVRGSTPGATHAPQLA